MDYQIRENVECIRADLRNGALTVIRNTNHMVRLHVEGVSENSMRVFAYNNILYIKCLSDHPAQIELYVPEKVERLHLKAENTNFTITDIEIDCIEITSSGNCFVDSATIRKQCTFNLDSGKLSLRSSDISSMNIQVFKGEIDFQGTQLHGNNIAYLINSAVNGVLKGALVDYVISAGGEVSPDNVIVNDHLLSEFPNRKNVQNCAWLLLTGKLRSTSRIYIKKPKVRY